LKYLREYIDDDQIPYFLGGSNHVEVADDYGPW
jgi:hypothetical protein